MVACATYCRRIQRIVQTSSLHKKIDLDILVKKLEEDPKYGGRKDVKYFTSPPASGKTCAVLPAFLRSAERPGGFTHYIYIAFHNNHKKNFNARLSAGGGRDAAYDQGAAFIINCLKNILKR